MNDKKTPPDGQDPTVTFPGGSLTPGRIGPYRILQKLGEGGMGVVYLAEQVHPIRRRVALKIIKLGMDTNAVIGRFEAERQALALMDHPNVAKVLDAGTTEQGRPYFVMEYVKGVPITEHCDRQKLGTKDRLGIFTQVCDGVQHAHQKGIIHRDIKPSNVLVQTQDGKRIPKIIDFGVAKATAYRLTEQTVFTRLGQIIGTPEYMSPEQAEMTAEDIDTRTDVYSLGVMLYQLLVGTLPFDPTGLRQAGFDEIRRRIREEEPSKPSTRVSSLGEASREPAGNRQTDPASLIRQLRGDLDWITMRALEKDRGRRYGSPAELAADIGRHLDNQPVLASPPSTLYRARKFVRRHRLAVAVAAVAVVLVIGIAVRERVQYRQIATERDRANREREASDRVSEFLADMLGSVDPETLGTALWKDLRERVTEVHRGRGATETQVEAAVTSLGKSLSGVSATDAALRLLDEQVLARAGGTIEQELEQEPRIAGRLEHTLGDTYRKLGLYERSEPHATRAVELRGRELGADHPDTLRSMHSLTGLYKGQGLYAEAEPLILETLEIRKRVLGDDHPDTLASMENLADLYLGQGRPDEAEPLVLETLEVRKRVLGDDHPDTLGSMHTLARLYSRQRRYAEAEPLYLQTLEFRKRVLGDDHPDTLNSINNLANVYLRQGRHAEAEPLYLETLEIRRRVHGDDHPITIGSMHNLAHLYYKQGRLAEAEPLYLETLENRRRVLGDDHPNILGSMNNLAALYHGQGRYAEAESLMREMLDLQRRVLGDEHPSTISSLYNLGCVAALRGNREAALGFLRQAVQNGLARPTIAEDSDLAILHGDPEFEAIVAEVKKRIGEE